MSSDITTKLAQKYYKNHFGINDIAYWYCIFVTIPSLLAAITFFLDVVIYNYFYYSFKIVPILIIVIFLILKRLLKIWAITGIVEAEQYIKVTLINGNIR